MFFYNLIIINSLKNIYVHVYNQVSDAEKDAVPEHVKEAARQMGQKAYKERLKEIEMTEYDDKVYNEYSLPVKNQVK